MIVTLLKSIDAKLGEIIKILRTPEDFTKEDLAVRSTAESVNKALQHLPPEQKP